MANLFIVYPMMDSLQKMSFKFPFLEEEKTFELVVCVASTAVDQPSQIQIFISITSHITHDGGADDNLDDDDDFADDDEDNYSYDDDDDNDDDDDDLNDDDSSQVLRLTRLPVA